MPEIRYSCFCLLLLGCLLLAATAQTDDVGALTALMKLWQKTAPPSWGTADPCEWDGVGCNGSRVTSLKLSSMGLEGEDIGDIGSLTQLEVLDLSSNPGLTARIPQSIGNLANLTTLILASCNFTGPIPEELGNLKKLTFLALNDNKLIGQIPSSFGNLANIYWLDFADNMLSGPLPVSSGSTPGLENLVMAQHFHFSRNQLSGSVPSSLFTSEMQLKHILFDGNNFSGPIPSTVGLLNGTLEVLRLDGNSFDDAVPDTLGNLVKLNELNLSSNQLIGPLPNLTLLDNLNSVDLSNNLFDASVAPSWFTTIKSLTTLVLEFGKLEGEVPQDLFSLPLIQQVKLKNNSFNGTLAMGDSVSGSLQFVDLSNNQISDVTGTRNVTVRLDGNPVCSSDQSLCSRPPYEQAKAPYVTSLANCRNPDCPGGEKLCPNTCSCAHPYEGFMQFRAIRFSDLSNATAFQSLERELCVNLDLAPHSVFLDSPFFDQKGVVQLATFFFPSTGEYFNRSEISRMGYDLPRHTYKIPPEFGPYAFKGYPYPFPEGEGKRGLSGAIIKGIAVGCSVLLLALLALAVYAIQQKRRADNATIQSSRPFASWGGTSAKDTGEAPQLKGAQWFSFDEVKKFTNNFSASNEIGSGGFGKVYKGTLPNGQMVAVKRASQGSMQGGVEFKTEIELLSRVHHRNLVSLVGFCFDRGEQMLVYEFVPNGTLRDSLSGRSGIRLDWKRRLRVSLGSARGLAYLHELANPPIIHRDVKSTNILLDESLVAKVADFGLSKLVADSEKGHVSTQVKGTMGYLDPEYYMMQKLTEKSDVYSFGVVMLELVTGKAPIERGKYVVREVRMAIDKRKEVCGLEGLLDPAIRGIALSGFDRFVDLAMRCVEESASDRPTMGEVVKEIETILQNVGVDSNPSSVSSSANDFGTSKGAPPRHPYNDPMPARFSDEFSHSSGYTFPTKIEPK